MEVPAYRDLLEGERNSSCVLGLQADANGAADESEQQPGPPAAGDVRDVRLLLALRRLAGTLRTACLTSLGGEARV